MNALRARRAAAAAGLALALLAGGGAQARAGTAGLSVFEAFAASRTVTMQPRAAALLSLVVEQYVGATHALADSAPRAQGYAATYGIPVASDLHGAGIPLSYGGQCYANYPGETQADCGVPIPGVVAPRPPEGSPLDGGMFFARANAVGDPVDTQKLSAAGATESGGFRLADVVDVGFNRSRSRTFLDDKGVHAVTASAAKDIRVGTALSIASISAVAEVFHGGDLATATGKASTDIEGVTIGGVPVLIGPEGVMVQGAKLAEAKTPDADAVRKAMAAQGLSIEPLAAPSVSKDQSTGYVNATASGFKLLLRRPTGDQFSITFGDASARATAVRASAAQGDSDLLLSAGPTNPSAAASPPGREPEPALGWAA